MYSKEEQKVVDYLKLHKGWAGLYIIRVKAGKSSLLKEICKTLGVEHKSDVAYVGKAAKLKTTDLYVRSRQEMGWSNFSGATFVKKIGMYLGFKVELNKKKDQLETRIFIIENFNIECEFQPKDKNLLTWEAEQIKQLKACLNNKKNK